MRFAILLAACAAASFAEPASPWIDRVVPLSLQRGTTARVELHGNDLASITKADFHTAEIEWLETHEATDKKVTGTVRVSARAALGPHAVQAHGKRGPTNSRLFNVTQFVAVTEAEPNDTPASAQQIRLEPQSIQGYMKGLIDVDLYAFEARAGERWVFDLRSLEYGTHLECEMMLLDARGRPVGMNDDRDDFDESPLLEHTFAMSARYLLKLDQYRGPQGVSCSENCGYSLEISRLPRFQSVFPLGAKAGGTYRFRLHGSGLDSVESVWLAPVRSAEHYRMTYPYTFPVRFAPDPRTAREERRVEGRLRSKSATEIEAEAAIPPDAPRGLWRVWTAGRHGAAAAFNIEIGDAAESEESAGMLVAVPGVVNGVLSKPDEQDVFRFRATAGEPVRFWTLAAQMGLPFIDTVLEVRDARGKVVAEHDDTMTGQGTPVGNPDSSLVFVPKESGEFTLAVRDRIGGGGASYVYRLHAAKEAAGFQLLTSPENFTVVRGGKANLTAFLIREPGFEGEVPVWFEDLPAGVTAKGGTFRADQAFGPSADGDNMIIPEMALEVSADASVAPGTYRLRLVGKSPVDGRVVEAHTSLWIGPPRNRNDIRRPRPAVTVTVVDP